MPQSDLPPLECIGRCAECGFPDTTVLKHLTASERQLLEKCASGQHFMRKAVIFAQGDILQNVYLIRRGTIKVSIPGRAGKEHIVRLSGARDLIGYQSVLTENISPTTATAMTPTEVCVIPKSCFFSLLRSNNTLARRILSMLAREIENAQYRMYSLSYKSVRARIAESLLAMARYYGYQADGHTIAGPIYRKDLAELAGVTIESTIRCLSDFRKSGLVALADKHVILPEEKLLAAVAQNV